MCNLEALTARLKVGVDVHVVHGLPRDRATVDAAIET